MKTAPEAAYLRPERHIGEFSGNFPDKIWKKVAEVCGEKEKFTGWDDWCFFPTFISDLLLRTYGMPPKSPQAISLSTFANWRRTKGVYELDPTILDQLWDSSVDGDLPTELLHRLPEPCPYVITPGLELSNGWKVHGFFVHLDSPGETGLRQLQFLIDEEEGLRGLTLPVDRGTIHEALADVREDYTGSLSAEDWKFNESLATSLISITLYLCTVAGEITDDDGKLAKPTLPRLTKSKGRLVEVTASEPVRWNVGWRMGAKLRNAKIQAENERDGYGVGARKRPHVRRGHWHWWPTGPKHAPTGRVTKWLPPIPINVEVVDDLVTTVRPAS